VDEKERKWLQKHNGKGLLYRVKSKVNEITRAKPKPQGTVISPVTSPGTVTQAGTAQAVPPLVLASSVPIIKTPLAPVAPNEAGQAGF